MLNSHINLQKEENVPLANKGLLAKKSASGPLFIILKQKKT